MPTQLTLLFRNNDIEGLHAALKENPSLANTGMTYLDQGHSALAHPLHRLCDAVFVEAITDAQAVELAKVMVACGADVNGNYPEEGSTPLIAAASLHCQQLGIYYLEQGAAVSPTEHHGGASALHWACYCGVDLLTQKLINAGADLNLRETKYNCTPTEWAVHALMNQPKHVMHHQIPCVKLMLEAGADQSLFSERFRVHLRDIAAGDADLQALLQ